MTDLTVLKWVLIAVFGLTGLVDAIKAATRDTTSTNPGVRAADAVINLGFIYWILVVM